MLAIRNFGHFWSKSDVAWGRPGSAGSLQGYVMHNRRAQIVDFRDQIAIYVLFTEGREVIYVGQSGGRANQRLFQRLKHHAHGPLRDRWSHFSWFGLRDVNDRGELSSQQKPRSRCLGTNADALNEVEAILLQLFEPSLNKQGPRWKRQAREYLQYVPEDWEDLETDQQRQFRELTDQINDLAKLVKKKRV